MCIYLKGNRGKFHPDAILNDGDLGFLKNIPNKNNINNNNNDNSSKMSSDIWDHLFCWSKKLPEINCPRTGRRSTTPYIRNVASHETQKVGQILKIRSDKI